MAKNNNLTDFLKGLADKFRSVLGTSALIDPQDFEDQIQQVYNHGFSEGGPSGITATAADVLSGKVFGSGGNAKATGTMPQRASVSTASKITYDGARVTGRFPGGYYPDYDSSGAGLYLPNANVASAIGLTAAKIVSGNTILGIAGSGVKSTGVNFTFSSGGYTENENLNRKLPNNGNAWGDASVTNTRYATLPAGTYYVVGCCGYMAGAGQGGSVYVAKSGALTSSLCSATMTETSVGSGRATYGTFYTSFTLSQTTAVTIVIVQSAGWQFGSFGAVCVARK